MEDIDELKRALEAAQLRAATAEAFAGQAEARIAELEATVDALQKQQAAQKGATAPQRPSSASDDLRRSFEKALEERHRQMERPTARELERRFAEDKAERHRSLSEYLKYLMTAPTTFDDYIHDIEYRRLPMLPPRTIRTIRMARKVMFDRNELTGDVVVRAATGEYDVDKDEMAYLAVVIRRKASAAEVRRTIQELLIEVSERTGGPISDDALDRVIQGVAKAGSGKKNYEVEI